MSERARMASPSVTETRRVPLSVLYHVDSLLGLAQHRGVDEDWKAECRLLRIALDGMIRQGKDATDDGGRFPTEAGR